MAEKSFSDVFTENMTAIGLPVPSSLFGALGTTLGTVGAIAGAISKFGTSVTVAEIILTLPLEGSAVVVAAAVGDIVAACGAVAAAFYVGACIGSVLVAAYETLAVPALAKVASWAVDLGTKLGMPLWQFMEQVLNTYPRLATIRQSRQLASLMVSAPSFATA